MIAMICFLCASEVEITETDLGRTWRCECGRTHGVELNSGALDLGLLEPEQVPDGSPEYGVG